MTDTAKLFADGLFKGLAEDETVAFLRRCQEQTYRDGTSLFKEQTRADKLYLLLAGEVVITQAEVLGAECGAVETETTLELSGKDELVNWARRGLETPDI